MSSTSTEERPEKFYTIKEAAGLLGLRYWHLQRAVKRELVPSHCLLTKKRFLRLSEILRAFEQPRKESPR